MESRLDTRGSPHEAPCQTPVVLDPPKRHSSCHSPLCDLFVVVHACLCGVPREFLAQSHRLVLKPQVWATQLSPTDSTRLQRCFVNLCHWRLLNSERSAVRVPLNDPPLSRSKPWSLGLFRGLFGGFAKGHVLNTPLKSSEVLHFPGFRVGGVVKGHAKGHAKGRAMFRDSLKRKRTESFVPENSHDKSQKWPTRLAQRSSRNRQRHQGDDHRY